MLGQDSKRLIELLEDSVALYKKDRQMAVDNYEMLRDQLKQITTTQEMSEEGKLEKEVNMALKNVFLSGERLDAVIQALSKILIGSMHAQARVQAAQAFNGMANGAHEKVITAPIDITKLLAEGNEDE
jgi:hypothetical protein